MKPKMVVRLYTNEKGKEKKITFFCLIGEFSFSNFYLSFSLFIYLFACEMGCFNVHDDWSFPHLYGYGCGV